MKPLINLKSFLAVLLILIVPAALLVAYFRDYSSGAGGHVHSEMGKGGGAALRKDDDSHAAMGHDTIPKPQGEQMQPQQQAQTFQPPAAQPQKKGGHAAMGHDRMAEPSTAQSQSPPGQGPQQAGASHLYHVGATGFFLDHPQHITLSTGQRRRLNQIKEQALLNKASADRKVQEAEQQLWKSTASDQPNPAEIETKVREIEKVRVDQRLAFIRSVGEAAKVLTEEQTKILLGTAAPVMPDAKPATAGNKPTTKPAAESAHPHQP